MAKTLDETLRTTQIELERIRKRLRKASYQDVSQHNPMANELRIVAAEVGCARDGVKIARWHWSNEPTT